MSPTADEAQSQARDSFSYNASAPSLGCERAYEPELEGLEVVLERVHGGEEVRVESNKRKTGSTNGFQGHIHEGLHALGSLRARQVYGLRTTAAACP